METCDVATLVLGELCRRVRSANGYHYDQFQHKDVVFEWVRWVRENYPEATDVAFNVQYVCSISPQSHATFMTNINSNVTSGNSSPIGDGNVSGSKNIAATGASSIENAVIEDRRELKELPQEISKAVHDAAAYAGSIPEESDREKMIAAVAEVERFARTKENEPQAKNALESIKNYAQTAAYGLSGLYYATKLVFDYGASG